MTEFFDELETREPQLRESDLFERLAAFLPKARKSVEGLNNWLGEIDTSSVTDRAALSGLPVLRKPELMDMQAARPPFGGFVDSAALNGTRVFMSPGPIWEPQGLGADPWLAARGLFAAGIRPGDIVHNALSYHMTPGGFLLEEGVRALGCVVFPAGIGNTEMQVDAAAALKPTVYCGTPDYLKVMLDAAAESGKDLSSIRRGLVSGGALFPSLREEYASRGVSILQAYATADIGIIAYETADQDGNPNPGMVVNENLIVEIVRPGTGDPVAEGEVGELVVTTFNQIYPLLRFGTGDLTAVLPGTSPCGRTNMRLKGWMGRADQRTKIKGMFVDPKQVAEIVSRHPGIDRARLVVSRDGAQDTMTLLVLPVAGTTIDEAAVAGTIRDITKLKGSVKTADASQLPNDGKVIADERDYSA